MDHIVPVAQGGTNTEENLALACFHCNRRKTDRQRGIEPTSGREVPLFHPRQQHWGTHFVWSADGVRLVGVSPTGRATITALDLNRARILRIRMADIEVGRHPPSSDPRYAPGEPMA